MNKVQTRYLHVFTIVVLVLALSRCAYVGYNDLQGGEKSHGEATADSLVVSPAVPSTPETMPATETPSADKAAPDAKAIVETRVETPKKWHRILSVPSFKVAFPDSNDVQLVSAKKYGVPPVQNRADAERRKTELVYAAANPYFHVDKLRESIPYLVPRASNLLQDIGRSFYDSLYVKGIPLHKIIVTSVLRTEEDVERLRRHNHNASENSCHRFGTTFDICYNRYITVETKKEPRRKVQNDSLKWVLSEVLRDMRESGRCYVKYEVKQGCFHITVR